MPVFRYEQKGAAPLMLMKLVRLVSTLRAARVLLDRGFLQAAGTLVRVLDEIHEDVMFMIIGLKNLTGRHREYLGYSYEEEFDEKTALASTQKRGMVPRQKIRACIARFVAGLPGASGDWSGAAEILRTVDKFQSGYVHGASTHLMLLYGGDPPRFRMNGIKGSVANAIQQEEFRIHVHLAMILIATVGTILRGAGEYAELRSLAKWFERPEPGRDDGGQP